MKFGDAFGVMGNVGESSFADIWNEKEAGWIRRHILEKGGNYLRNGRME